MNLPNQARPVSRQTIFLDNLSNEVNPSVCVNGTVSGNRACVNIPIIGNQCVTLPFSAPIGATVSACTCGSIIPTGAQIKVSVGGSTIWSTSIGRC